jgi:hypothetical protein
MKENEDSVRETPPYNSILAKINTLHNSKCESTMRSISLRMINFKRSMKYPTRPSDTLENLPCVMTLQN